MNDTLISLEERAGTDVKGIDSLDSLITKAGFDFEVEKAQLYSPEGGEVNNMFMLRRKDTKVPLNVVRGRYQLVHNREMLEPFDNMVNEYGATYENAGIVGGGRVCWVSAKLDNDIVARADDKVEQRIIALVYHDGTRRNSYFQYTRRIFCNNQLRSMEEEGRKGYTVGHTASWENQLQAARLGFDKAIGGAKRFGEQVQGLANNRMSDNQAECFLQHMYPFTKESSDRQVTRANNVRENVLGLFSEGAGNVGESRWDMLNAVTEYYDHHRKQRSTRSFINEMTGMGADRHKQNALGMLLDSGTFRAIDPKRN